LIKETPTEEDKASAQHGLAESRQAIMSGRYDLVILDEATIAVWFDLLSVDDLLDLIKKKPLHVELVITGRKADPRLIEAADLVTEMQEIKHYYTQGVLARAGIED
jgi:cob(I)alamin adenosyltransferase